MQTKFPAAWSPCRKIHLILAICKRVWYYSFVEAAQNAARCAGVSELADETDSKSVIREGVWVRAPPPASDLNSPQAPDISGACGLFFMLCFSLQRPPYIGRFTVFRLVSGGTLEGNSCLHPLKFREIESQTFDKIVSEIIVMIITHFSCQQIIHKYRLLICS